MAFMFAGIELEKVSSKDVKVGDYVYIKTEEKLYQFVEIGGLYNAINVSKLEDYADSNWEIDFNDYISSWCDTWLYGEEIVLYKKREKEETLSLSFHSMLELAKTNDFSGICSSPSELKLEFKFIQGEMFIYNKVIEKWIEPTITVYWLDWKYDIETNTIKEWSE